MRIVQRFAQTAAANLKKIALITEKNQLSFEDLLFLTETIEAQALSRGLKDGARVLLTTGRAEFIFVFWLLASRRSLQLVIGSLAQAQAAGVAFDMLIGTERDEGVDPQIVIEPDWFHALGTGRLPDLSQAFGDGGAIITATSGSTGTPKFLFTTEEDRLATGTGPRDRTSRYHANTRFLSTMTSTQGWTMGAILHTLLNGGSAVALDQDRNRIAQYIDLYRVSYLQTTPAVIRNIFDLPNPDSYLASLERILVSGALTSETLLKMLAAKTTSAIEYGYGASEIGGISTTVYDRNGSQKPGYLGDFYRTDLELAFLDDSFQPISGASEGLVGFRRIDGPTTRRHYVGRGDPTQQTGYINGYFVPGDLLRQEGKSLYFLGRSKNIINFSGNKYALDTIQAALEPLLTRGQLACCVTTDKFGIECLDVYHTAPELDLGRVDTALVTNFDGLRAARVVRVDSLPLTPSGKIDRMRLGQP